MRRLLHVGIDLRLSLKGTAEEAPARHPLPVPARLSLGDGFGRLYLDTAKVEIIRSERLDFGIALIFACEVMPMVFIIGTASTLAVGYILRRIEVCNAFFPLRPPIT